MAHESFEDAETARLMNEHFVGIKVDREERPDLDAIYMEAVQAMSGSGGWPMTVFLTPDGSRSTAAPTSRRRTAHGLPSFTRVLLAASEAYRRGEPRCRAPWTRSPAALRRRRAFGRCGLPAEPVDQAAKALEQAFDAATGGFGGAPKFPQPMALEFLLAAQPCPWWSGRWRPWRAAASTISWAAASTATAWTRTGWCRTSRRCCTTTPCSPGLSDA